MWEFRREFRFITQIMELTFEEKEKECENIFSFFERLCVMVDIGEDILQVEGVKLPYYICSLTLRAFLEFQANLLQGAYHSAGRSLRWLYEANVAAGTACLNPSLLHKQFSGLKSIDQSEFEKWLGQCDKGETRFTRGMRKEFFEFLNLDQENLNNLYSDLCKYSHISKISFDKDLDWPKLQYIPEKFGEIFELTKRTLDLVLLMQSKIHLNYDGETRKALTGFLKDSDGLNRLIPMTIHLISNI